MKTPYEWRIDFYSAGAWRTLANIQSVSIFRGRRLQIDDYNSDTLNVECRNPSGWTYTPKLGDKIVAYVYRPGVVVGVDKYPGFIGTIRDVDINYGKIASLDTVTISGEGIQADWGRAQLNSLVLTQEKTDEQILDAATAAGLGISQFGAMSTASAQTYTGNALELVNALVRTEEARIYAYPYQYSITWPGTWLLYYRGRGSNIDLNTKWLFNDGTVTANTYDNKYDNIVFRSSADNYYNQVTIQPEFVAAQTATLSTTPIFSWAKTTVDFSTAQALSHAQWLLNNFQTKDSTVAAISFTEMEQNDKLPDPFTTENPQPLLMITEAISAGVTIGFRSNTYNCVCEGIAITGTPEQTRITLYLSGQDTNAYLVLNDAIYGKLNSNKLGF
jgi:hypothetical protein